jgi:hypothetical protein
VNLKLLVGLVVLALPFRLAAVQTTETGSASVSGVVSDENGGRLSDVSIEVREEYNRWTASAATTNKGGVFLVDRLPAGQARVTARLRGYQTQVFTNVQLQNDREVRLQMKLRPEKIPPSFD